MKITTFKLLQVTIILSVLFLSTIARLTYKHKNKNNRKFKSKKFHRISISNKNGHTTNNNINNNSTDQPKEDPIVIAKKSCLSSCSNELKESRDGVHLQDQVPVKNESNLYVKKKDEDTEYYLCECLLSNDSQIVQKEFFFANKNNVKAFLKGDDDGRKVYKKTLKKGLSESANAIYQIVN